MPSETIAISLCGVVPRGTGRSSQVMGAREAQVMRGLRQAGVVSRDAEEVGSQTG